MNMKRDGTEPKDDPVTPAVPSPQSLQLEEGEVVEAVTCTPSVGSYLPLPSYLLRTYCCTVQEQLRTRSGSTLRT